MIYTIFRWTRKTPKGRKNMAYTRFFASENDARSICQIKNQACRRAGNFKDIYCLVDGPEDNYAIVDLKTAIDLGMGYEIIG